MRIDRLVQGLFEESATAKHQLGDTYEWYGRLFMYKKAAEILAKGAQVVTKDAYYYTVDSVGAGNTVTEYSPFGGMVANQVVNIADAGAAVAENELAGMLLYTDSGSVTGGGQVAWIMGNTVGASGSAMKIYLFNALDTALDDTSDITVISEHVVEKSAVTTSVQPIIGVTNCAVTADYYFWAQKDGLGGPLVGEATTKHLSLTSGDDTEGTALMVDADALNAANIFGVGLATGVTDKRVPALLKCY